jgi:hypothetical protein
MNASTKYEKWRGHPPDFTSRYRFYTPEEGGRQHLPGQYYRGDFMYAEDSPQDGIYMIHHEFTGEDGMVLPEATLPIPRSGTARMWIVVPEIRGKVHCRRIAEGTRYYIMEGSRRVGEGVVTGILGLHTNPTEPANKPCVATGDSASG